MDGCSNHNCRIRKPTGQGTNGGCKCDTRAIIAQLTAELAEARRELDRVTSDPLAWRRDVLSAQAERDAARAELTKSAHEHAVMRQRLEKTQAEAAAMREMLEEVVRACDQVSTDPKMFARKAAIALVMMRGGAAMALIGTAGRALAARASLLEKTLERIAEIFPQLQSSFIHGEHGTAAKLLTALGVALAALDDKGGG